KKRPQERADKRAGWKKKKDMPGDETPSESGESGPAAKPARNVMDELSSDQTAEAPRSDQDALNELYKMGLEQNWEKKDEGGDGKPPVD
ncbi:MAG: hypothetical protein K5981_09325, partial [Clostridia bacterium]|nr:hypothetical protein [Clostridia bacterium]